MIGAVRAGLYSALYGGHALWSFTHHGKTLPDAIPDLAAALTIAPALKVVAMSGYHDLATSRAPAWKVRSQAALTSVRSRADAAAGALLRPGKCRAPCPFLHIAVSWRYQT
jgi:hypothetical protein